MKTATARAHTGAREPATRDWLKAATEWRVLSLLFQLPTRRTRRELKSLLPMTPREFAGLAREWAAVSLKAAEAEYHRVLGPGGIPAIESSYDPNALAGRGPLLADVRGFYEAFAYRPEKPPAELPDHIAVELDFLSYLAFKVAFARHEGREGEAQIAMQAYDRFQQEHLRTWLTPFHERLSEARGPFYGCISAILIRSARQDP